MTLTQDKYVLQQRTAHQSLEI